MIFSRSFFELHVFENIIAFAGYNSRCAFQLAEMINTKVISNTSHPGSKFSFLIVFARPKRIYCFNKCLLKNVFSEVFILYHKIDGCVDFILMTKNKSFKGKFVAREVLVYQFLIAH